MSRATFTVLGAGGVIGTALVTYLRQAGHVVTAVNRTGLAALFASRRSAGHVIDCIGLTGDFRARPLDTAEAHVSVTARCLAGLTFDSFLFLSSTRVYARAAGTNEDAPLPCLPGNPSDLYNITKLAGETLCLSDPRPTVRVARLSNVYAPNPGPDTFLGQVLCEGRATGAVLFHQAPESVKDYISLIDVIRLLPAIAASGQHRLYNVAAGRNTSHREIADVLRVRCGWITRFAPTAPIHAFPPIEIGRLHAEFSPPLNNILPDLPSIAAGQEVSWPPSMHPAMSRSCAAIQ